jgi:kinetochore protein Mis13/DSN1
MAASQAQSRPTPASGGAGRGKGERRTTRNSASKQGLDDHTNDGKRKAGECYSSKNESPVTKEWVLTPLSIATDYVEEADGFQFSIVPTKKSRPSLEAVPEVSHSDVENAPPQSTPRRGRPPKKRTGEKAGAGAVPVKGQITELPTRKTTRGVASSADTQQEPQPDPATRSSRTREPLEDQPKKSRKRGRPSKSKPAEPNGYKSPEQPPAGTKIALPVADTPVIQRNKELRGDKSGKGRRRSSLDLRGRRASDLIDSGASNGRRYLMVSWRNIG